MPKTLIYAKDDSHADDIVRICREVFDKGNDFCQKITYHTTGVKPKDLIASFRNSYNPRITQYGGLGRAHQVFGPDLTVLLEELNRTLAA